MKLKELEYSISSVLPFQNAKYELEQYPTSNHIAARMIFLAECQFEDVSGKSVLDLGCGTGILAFASETMGSR